MDISNSLASLLKSKPELAEAAEKLQIAFSKLESDKEKAAKLFEEAVNAALFRPRGWRRNSNAPYYKEKYGILVKKWLEQMVADREDKLVKARSLRIGRKSLIALVSQAWEWLIENDPEGPKWLELRLGVEIRKAPDGVVLHFKEIAEGEIELVSVKRKELEEDNSWKEEMDDFINNAEDGKKLIIENLRLNDNQVDYIKSICAMTPGIFPKEISTVKIELLKSMALWNRLNS